MFLYISSGRHLTTQAAEAGRGTELNIWALEPVNAEDTSRADGACAGTKLSRDEGPQQSPGPPPSTQAWPRCSPVGVDGGGEGIQTLPLKIV